MTSRDLFDLIGWTTLILITVLACRRKNAVERAHRSDQAKWDAWTKRQWQEWRERRLPASPTARPITRIVIVQIVIRDPWPEGWPHITMTGGEIAHSKN
jgi:hypothetical protein